MCQPSEKRGGRSSAQRASAVVPVSLHFRSGWEESKETMRSIVIALVAVALGLVTASAQSTSDELGPSPTMLSEEDKTLLTALTLQLCLASAKARDDKHRPDEINNYCSCWAVMSTDRTTQAQYDTYNAVGHWPPSQRKCEGSADIVTTDT